MEPQVTTQTVEVNGVEIETVNTVATPVETSPLEAALDVEAEVVTEEATPEATPEVTQDAPAEAAEESTSQALVPRQNMAVGRAEQFGAGSGIDGDWGAEDLRFPQLKIVQGSGPLSAQFDQGTLLYADEELLPPPSMKEGAKNPWLRMVPISIKKQWREVLSKESQEEGEMPRVVDTVAEVEALGGTTRWIGGEQPNWKPSARCMFLIQQPEGCEHPGFALELDGSPFGVALFYAGGSAFATCPKVIFNTSLTSLLVPVLNDAGQPERDGKGRPMKRPLLWKCYWNLQWQKKQVGNFQVYQPIVRLDSRAETGPEVRAYCEQLTRGSEHTEAAAEVES